MIAPAPMNTAFQTVLSSLADEALRQVLHGNSYNAAHYYNENLFSAKFVPDSIHRCADLERRFTDVFKGAWETLAVEAAKAGLGHGAKGHTIRGTVRAERLRRIQEVLNTREHPDSAGGKRVQPDWNRELAYILEGEGEPVPTTIVCDVYAEDTTLHKRYAFELKAPLPNSDITKVSKEKILKLHSMEPLQVDGAYYALPYNPYGSRDKYDWSFPARWFNMREDDAVLIGDEFWDKIGGVGTYQVFVSAINEIGKEYRDRIYREFLEIEPPADAPQTVL